MKKKKLPILIGDIIALSTVFALVFIVVYSYLTSKENNYVYFIIDDKSFNLLQLIVMCLLPLLVSVIVYFKSRKKFKSHTIDNIYDVVLYMCSNMSICLLSIINFIFVFLNIYSYYDVNVFDIEIMPDKQDLLYYIIVPLSVLIIIISILLKIILYKHNKKSDSYHFDICIMFNVINIIVCYFFSNILLVVIIIVGLIYGLITNKF